MFKMAQDADGHLPLWFSILVGIVAYYIVPICSYGIEAIMRQWSDTMECIKKTADETEMARLEKLQQEYNIVNGVLGNRCKVKLMFDLNYEIVVANLNFEVPANYISEKWLLRRDIIKINSLTCMRQGKDYSYFDYDTLPTWIPTLTGQLIYLPCRISEGIPAWNLSMGLLKGSLSEIWMRFEIMEDNQYYDIVIGRHFLTNEAYSYGQSEKTFKYLSAKPSQNAI